MPPNAPYCKIIAGLTGRAGERVERLACLYRLAGADWLDVAADPAMVAAAHRGIALANAWLASQQVVAPAWLPERLQVMVSCGLAGDPHVGTALLDASVCATCAGCVIPAEKLCAERPLAVRAPECPACRACFAACPFGAIRVAAPVDGQGAVLAACLAEGAAGVELHVAGSQAATVAAAIAPVAALLGPSHTLSLSLGAAVHGLADVLAIARLRHAWPQLAWLLQVEGAAMSGTSGSGDTAALDLVAAVVAQDPSAPVQIAGGAGLATAARCVARGLHVRGIGFGSAARLAVAPALDCAEFSLASAEVVAALAAAVALVGSVRGAAAAAGAWRASLRQAKVYQSSYSPASIHEIKLNHNEAPADLPTELKAQVLTRLAEVPWHRYTDGDGLTLRRSLAAATGHPAEGIAIGNGANELLQRVLTALGPHTTLVLTAPDYYLYARAAEVLGIQTVVVPLRQVGLHFAVDVDGLLAAAAGRPALLLLSQPNNPTGTLFAKLAIDRLLGEFPGPIVLDEAYTAFCGVTRQADLAWRHNLLLVRTLSKAEALAGLRLGYLLGNPALISEINKLVPPYPLSVLNAVAAEVVLGAPLLRAERLAEVCAARAELTEGLQALGLDVAPSATNFVLVAFGDRRHAALEALSRAGFAVRDMGTAGALAGCLRITVATPAVHARFLTALRLALAR